MDMRKPMTETEKRLFKEAVIKEYKLKHQPQSKKQIVSKILNRLKALVPVNIFVGIVASALLVYLFGFKTLIYLLLFGIIWITLISTIISAFIKTE